MRDRACPRFILAGEVHAVWATLVVPVYEIVATFEQTVPAARGTTGEL